MIKNITLRFLTIFFVFFIAGVLLLFTLKGALELYEENKHFDQSVLVPIDDLSETLQKIHLQRIANRSGSRVPGATKRVAVTQLSKLVGTICRYNEKTLKSYTIERECERLRKEIETFVAYASDTPSQKLVAAFETLRGHLHSLRKSYIETFERFTEDQKKRLQATFYISFFFAAATLTLLFFLLMEVNSLNRKLKTYLLERENFQKELATANEELARYSEELESEVKKRTEEALDHLKKNPLTKLPNRLSFIEKIENLPAASVAIFNIDRFQSYNDLFGSNVGDKIIQDYAAYLRSVIPYIYEIYHLQGDEFAILETNEKSSATFFSMITQAAKLASEFPFMVTNGEFVLQISIGVAINQPQPLIKADMALKHAKHSSENMVIYSDGLIKPQHYLENIMMTKELTTAIKEERIVPYFQAIADTRTKKIQKYEVLARLEDEKGKIYPPIRFIPLAKQIRLYSEITKIIFKKSMDAVEKYGLFLSINLSADDIHHRPTRDYIIDRIAMSKYSDHITLELLESEEAKNYEDISAFIERVKHYGVKIAIDDFGSGYSNFAKILKLKIDSLKIDGSFVSRIAEDADSREFVEIIHNLAKNYNIDTVAEFVSNDAIYNIVRDIGITSIQGYYLHQPEPLERILRHSNPL
ncbi:bifunctional diguanylate cyclase/phosphodiesterase [Hydrogenimonas urashimensis]|uniref:bifunctional diguanylate cyclase/phosphodiesterase n=1 Tax=Hydrogenimonas urashimensis TaxID=2740515 RepID=UPI0019169A9B|nr:bifunctional diguanylate cyclase/phosphodiesterase [Hydrogenimonas urashimensis]